MTTYNYDSNVPAANNSPKNDQPQMQVNAGSISGIISEDHIGFNTPNGGYHTIIHQPNQTVNGQSAWNPVIGSGVPAAISAAKISNIQQLFSMLYTPDTTGGTPDTQLFSLTGDGGISQLTGNLSTSDGWVWLGGILLQWGVVTAPPPGGGSFASGLASGDVTFKDRVPGAIPFPNNCFLVLAVPYWSAVAPSGTGTVSASEANLTTFSFTWLFRSSVSQYTGFYWIAIGN